VRPAWARKSPQMTEVLPLLYLHGLSSGDFGAALSATSITRLTTPSSKTNPRHFRSETSRVLTSSTCGSTASISSFAWSRRSYACW
jgi:hypothetical protein